MAQQDSLYSFPQWLNPQADSLINIVLDLVSLMILMVILYSSLVQSKENQSRKALLFWNTNLICLLVCELALEAVCIFLPSASDNSVLLILHRALFVIDFLLYNTLPITYYRYVQSFLTTTPASEKKLRRGLTIIKVSVILLTAVFASSMSTGLFYTIDAYTFEYYKPSYLILEAVALANWLLLTIPLKYCKQQYGSKKRSILAMYVWLPLLLLPLDYIFNLTLSYCAFALITLLIYVEVDIRQAKEHAVLEAKMAQAENQMKDMQVELMMSKIHPHFLYNTLSSISCLCRQDPKEAEAATNDFSNYLKANLSSINSTKPISFSRELLHAESYLNIQKRRFPDTLRVVMNIQAKDFSLPALTLQTIVENSIKHAVESRYEPTTIKITTFEAPLAYIITVEDDGPGFIEAAPLSEDRPHLGISSTKARLKEMSGGELTISSTPGKGTLVTISIPKTLEK